jgi:drug/metabolite transporter (DMT)-like permease
MDGSRVRGGEHALLVAAALYGVSTAVSVVALRQVRPADLLAIELIGAAAVLLVVAARTGRLRRRTALRQMSVGALAPGLAYLFGDLGLARTSASSGSLLLAAEPLLSVLLALAVLGERIRGRAVTALVIGLAGSVVVAFGARPGGAGESLSGNLLVLAAVAASAVYLVAARHLSDGGDGLNAGAWQVTGGALTTAPFLVLSWAHGGSRLDTAGPAAWAACGAVLVCGAVADVAFNRGIGRVPAARAGQLANLTPVVGTLTGVVALGDRPGPLPAAGGVAILAGLILLLRDTAPAGAAPSGSDPPALAAASTVPEPAAVAPSAVSVPSAATRNADTVPLPAVEA